MAAEPVVSKDVDELFNRFNLWLVHTRPSIADASWRDKHQRRYCVVAGSLAAVCWRRTVVIRERHLPGKGAVLRAPHSLTYHSLPNQWAQQSLRVEREIAYEAAKAELRMLAAWVQARDCAVAPWSPAGIAAGQTDGRLRRHGNHNYGFDIYVPGGGIVVDGKAVDLLEITGVANDLRNNCTKALDSDSVQLYN